jgi:outer membrane protein assembly factor BamA
MGQPVMNICHYQSAVYITHLVTAFWSSQIVLPDSKARKKIWQMLLSFCIVLAMPIRTARILLSISLCFLFASGLSAQKYMPKQITFSGYSDASQAELLAATGLKPGVPIGQPEIQAAAQKLSDTGLFSDIRFSFDGVDLNYALKPATGAEPALYENFPWWQSQALTAAIAAKVPLFHGLVIPESGLQSQVVAALTALLQQKGVSATVIAMPRNNLAGQAVGTEFRIESPPVQVGEVKFEGASPAWMAPLAAIQKAAVGQDVGSDTESQLTAAVDAIYRRKGYLDISLSHFAYGQPQLIGGKVLVPVSAALDEGAQYHLSGLKLSGDVWMSPEDFAKNARIHAGDIADEDLLRQTLAMIAQPYKAKGYLTARISAKPSFDHTNHTVDYSVTVTPGPVFHMGKLTLLNLDPERQAQVMQYWTMHTGDVFDATYPPAFLNRNRNNLHALDSWSADYKQYANLDTHVVDLVITFRPGGPLN